MAAPRIDRRLAAILAADVVGYSRLMGQDEAGTHARLKALRTELIEPSIAEHRGRIVKLMGDGALVEFPSVVEAVLCAVRVQRAVAERNRGVQKNERLEFRIGINLGDVIYDENDIYGDGVNVAARLEGLAEPGGICVSRTVYDHVKDKVDLAFAPLGAHKVKNIAEPVVVYQVALTPGAAALAKAKQAARATRRHWQAAAAGVTIIVAVAAAAWHGGVPYLALLGSTEPQADIQKAAALPLPDKPSVAVLSFDNLSGEERYERLADGITEDVIADLSRFRDLFVIARNSTFAYKDKPTDVRQIARELGVQYVLESSIQFDGDRVRVTAQLIDATTGNHVWSERYDRPLADVFAVQNEVTQSIVASLSGDQGALARARRETARRKPPDNLQTYDYYTIGMEAKHRFTKQDNKNAQELFQKTLDLDPNFARAYIGLAHTYNIEVDMGFGDSYQESMGNWLEATQKAIALDPYDSEARLLLGWYYQFLNDYDRAVAELNRALELNPNNADVLALAALLLGKAGQPERALDAAEQAIRLNPHHPDWYYGSLRDAYFYNQRFEEAIAAIKMRLSPNPLYDPLFRAMSYAQLGREQEAAREMAALLKANPDYSGEKFLSDTGTYARNAEMNLFLDSHRKAGLPLCATEEQLAKYPDMKRLKMCEAGGARS